MRTILDEAFIDFSKLKDKEKQMLRSELQNHLKQIEDKYVLQQQGFLQRQDEMLDRFARSAGFSGFSSGPDSYSEQHEAFVADPASVSSDIVDKLGKYKKCLSHSPEYAELLKQTECAARQEKEDLVWARQLYLNRALEIIRPRIITTQDNDGKPVLSPHAYNKCVEMGKKMISGPVSRVNTVPGPSGNDLVYIDAGINSLVSQLWEHGIRTNASCSGMVMDHPHDRFTEDDRFGRWKRGDLQMAYNSPASAYLSLPVDGNHPELLRRSAEKAHAWGCTTDLLESNGQKSLVFRPLYCLDGTTYDAVMREASGLKDTFLRSGEAADDEEVLHLARTAAEKSHGGAVRYTDRMLDDIFKRLFAGLRVTRAAIRKEERQHNIDTGKAVTVITYDSDIVLTVPQLKAVFLRSGITLDESGLDCPLSRKCEFVVRGGEATLLPADAPKLPWESVKENRTLSYLMAGQVRDTPRWDGDRLTVMVHPDPQTAGAAAEFSISRDFPDYVRQASLDKDGDIRQLLASHFTDDLYRAAQHAYEHSMLKKVDDLKPYMPVSDIRIRKGMDNNVYISCKVMGEQQLSKRLTTVDVNYYRMRMAASDKAYNGVAPELALKYFAEEIENSRHQDRDLRHGVKR